MHIYMYIYIYIYIYIAWESRDRPWLRLNTSLERIVIFLLIYLLYLYTHTNKPAILLYLPNVLSILVIRKTCHCISFTI